MEKKGRLAISVSFDNAPEIHTAVEKLAKDERRTKAGMVRILIEEAIERRKRESKT